METTIVKKIALVAIFSALGIAMSPFTSFPFLGSKANPAQHMINAILGVLLGPFWAALTAIFIGTMRNMLGTGTLYAFPGGIPGGIIVGSAYWLLSRLKRSEKTRTLAALTEPIGTLLIGVPPAVLLVAPLIGDQKFLNQASEQGLLYASLFFSLVWAASCISGSIIGFAIVTVLRKMGISREALFGKK